MSFLPFRDSLRRLTSAVRSTCIGRIGTFKGTSKLGTTTYDPPLGLLSLTRDKLNSKPLGRVRLQSLIHRIPSLAERHGVRARVGPQVAPG